MSLLERRLKAKKTSPLKPEWVNDKNATPKIYEQLLKLKEEKLAAVKVLTVAELKTKKNYQISAGELSRVTSMAKTTLTVTSSYSKALKEYLDTINTELKHHRDSRLHGYEINQHTVKQRKKNIIVDENKLLKNALEALQKENASEQVRLILNNLSLPVKTKLGLK